MDTYKIGQILTSTQDVEVEKALSGKKVIVPKGSKIIIGADNFAHYIRDGMFQSLGDAEVKGYDAEGLAEYLFLALKKYFPIDEMLEDYGIKEKDFKNEIEYALDCIGL